MVHIRSLRKTFEEREVLKGIDLDIERGSILAIMGSSGGGKTTLLRCIAGLIKPDSGSVTIDGISVENNPEEARRHMGMVFQSAALFDYLTVRDNVLFALTRLHPRESHEEELDRLLALVGLEDTEHLLPAELSGGMRKRVGIARALASRPAVMLYDEPTSGLDPVTAYSIDKMIVDVNEKYHVTTIVVTHDVSSMHRIADRVAFLDDGNLAFSGSISDVKGTQVEAFLEMINRSEAQAFCDS